MSSLWGRGKGDVMNTKKAIEFIKKHNKPIYFYTWERKEFKEIIKLLQRGEKYEEMCDELIDVGKNTWAMWEEFRAYIKGKSDALTNKMYLLEQKYFPKEKQ